MNFPQIKNALFCRILVYVVVIGGFFFPAMIVAVLNFVPEIIKVFIGFGCAIGLLVFIIMNFALLMTMDISLAMLDCYNAARKQFILPRNFSVQKAERRISRIGYKCEPMAISPRPEILRYKSQVPVTIYSSGIEKVIATYHIDCLDVRLYHQIINSAKVNSNQLKGKKKHFFLDKSQKNSPLNRVTVIVIYAKQVDEQLRNKLFDVVCKNSGDGYNDSILPCIVDLEKEICTFDSMRIPYIGFQYAVKNRGIKIIRKTLFNNKFTFANSIDMLDPIEELDPNQSLWNFWKTTKRELILDAKRSKKRFEKMKHREIVFEEDYISVKWYNQGVMIPVEMNEDVRVVEIEKIDMWAYPKSNKIAKADIKEIKSLINIYFTRLGYAVKYIE